VSIEPAPTTFHFRTRRRWIGAAVGFLLSLGLPAFYGFVFREGLFAGPLAGVRVLGTWLVVAVALMQAVAKASWSSIPARIVIEEGGFRLRALWTHRYWPYPSLVSAKVTDGGARLVFEGGEELEIIGYQPGMYEEKVPIGRELPRLCKALNAQKEAFAIEASSEAGVRFDPRGGESFRATLDNWRHPTYRERPPEKEVAYAVLENRAAHPAQRTRAAALLADDAEGKARIRVVAERTKAPIRAALLRIADAEDDVAVAEVVEAWEREHE
jgi:hypothetical protein